MIMTDKYLYMDLEQYLEFQTIITKNLYLLIVFL